MMNSRKERVLKYNYNQNNNDLIVSKIFFIAVTKRKFYINKKR